MIKKHRTLKRITLALLILLILVVSFVYVKYVYIKDMIVDTWTQVEFMELPKSETYKVTSTAKGDNQKKIGQLGDTIFTYYLDNSGCVDASARGNDKTLKLLMINDQGTYTIFDSIPVWMHGNVLVDVERSLIYYKTYEEVFNHDMYYGQVKIYTYDYNQGAPIRIDEKTLKDDLQHPYQANPRVGADIDDLGNIAVAYSNYTGTMYVHVYDALNEHWIEHSITYSDDTYLNDCNLYPYVRIKGINHIRIISNRDTTIKDDGTYSIDPMRDYTRYFSYEGSTWNDFIFSDLRDESTEKDCATSTPMDLYVDDDLTSHIIMKENNHLVYYMIDRDDKVTIKDMPAFHLELAIIFVRIMNINNHLYYAVSGEGLDGFHRIGYVSIYDYETNTLYYQTNDVCYTPYLYVIRASYDQKIHMMLISRDKDYDEHSETVFITIEIN